MHFNETMPVFNAFCSTNRRILQPLQLVQIRITTGGSTSHMSCVQDNLLGYFNNNRLGKKQACTLHNPYVYCCSLYLHWWLLCSRLQEMETSKSGQRPKPGLMCSGGTIVVSGRKERCYACQHEHVVCSQSE